MRMTVAPILLLAAALSAGGPARAEDSGCARLDAQVRAIDAAAAGDPTRIARYQDALDRQSDEIRRTSDYAQSIGCDAGSGEPQCRALDQNLRRMESNRRTLEAQFTRLSANVGAEREAERQRILSTYLDLGCAGDTTAAQVPAEQAPEPADRSRSAGMFERLFGPDEIDPGSEPQPEPSQQAALPVPVPETATLPSGGNLRTICVRRCDGYFFPISFSADASQVGADADACRRRCPGTEVELFAYDAYSQTADDAVSTVSGTPLKSMQNAFVFRTRLVPSCTCQKAGVSAAETPGDADDALRRLDEEGQVEKAAPAAPANPAGEAFAPNRRAPVESLPTTAGKAVESVTADGQKKRVRVIEARPVQPAAQ